MGVDFEWFPNDPDLVGDMKDDVDDKKKRRRKDNEMMMMMRIS